MKIAPFPPAVPREGQASTHAAASVSFAELLENGKAARALLSHRAIGFAECGILGVHFAHGQAAVASDSSTRATQTRPSDPIAVPIHPVPGPAESISDHSVPLGRTGAILDRESRGASLCTPHVDCNRTASPAAASTRLPAGRTNKPSTNDVPPSRGATLVLLQPRAKRCRTSLRIKLIEEGDRLVLIVEGISPGDSSILELETAARSLAWQYDAQIARLLVRPGGNCKGPANSGPATGGIPAPGRCHGHGARRAEGGKHGD